MQEIAGSWRKCFERPADNAREEKYRMRVDRQTRETKPRSGRVRAAALVAAWSRIGFLKRVLVLGLVCGCLLALSALASVAFAAPSVRSQIDSLEVQAQELQDQIAALDAQLEVSAEAYNQLVVQLDEVNVSMTVLRERQDAAQRDYQYRLRLYEDRLCELYKAGGQDKLLQMVLEAADVDDFISRARLAAELADQDRRLMDSLTRASDRLETVLAQVDQAKSQQLILRKQITDEQDRMTATLAARESTLANVDAQIAALMEAERQRQAEEQERLKLALAALLNGGQVYNGILPETDSAILGQFQQTAAAYVGIPYVWGGDRPSTGLDCSGYTQYVYRQHGVSLPHYSGYQAALGIPVDLANIQPGDLLAFGFPVHHVGIYIGDDLFLHAAGTGLDVRVGSLSSRDDVSAIRRFDLKARTGDPTFN
jgi:cell wall-associated NlpC family hydrolase